MLDMIKKKIAGDPIEEPVELKEIEQPVEEVTKIASIGVHLWPRELRQKLQIYLCCLLYDKETGERFTERIRDEVYSPYVNKAQFSNKDEHELFVESVQKIITDFANGIRQRHENYKIVVVTLSHKQFPCDIKFLRNDLIASMSTVAPNAFHAAYDECLLYEALDPQDTQCHAVCRFSDYIYFFSEHEFLGEEHKAKGEKTEFLVDVRDEAKRVSEFLFKIAQNEHKDTKLVVLVAGKSNPVQREELLTACISMNLALELNVSFELKWVENSEANTSYCAAMYGFKKVREMDAFRFMWHTQPNV